MCSRCSVHLNPFDDFVSLCSPCDFQMWRAPQLSSKQIYFVELKASNFLLTKYCLFTVVFNHIAQLMSSRTNGANHFWISNRHSHAKTTEIHTQQFIYTCTKNLTRRRLLVKHFLYFWNWTKLFHKEALKWLKRLTCTRSVIPTRYHSLGSPDSDVVFGSTQTSHLFN